MKTLILLRHAKSAWDDPLIDDIDRPLNARGRANAPVMGAWLAARGHRPDLVLCSPARRTRDTVELMPGLPAPVIEPRLYHAHPETMLDVLAGNGAECVLLVGHQPGLSELARRLARPPVPPDRAVAFADFPTAAAAVFAFDPSVTDRPTDHAAAFVAFATPRGLNA